MKTQKISFFLCITALILSMFSCKNDDDESITQLSDSVRVTAFSLVKDDSVLVNLDTVFFTIDLDRGLIYNADSLPKGTDVSALVANINFDNVSEAMIYVDKGDPAKNDTINYAFAPNDSIDFTGKVSLKVTSESGLNVMTYSVKVNVHRIYPDSLYWTVPFGVKSLPCGKEVAVDEQKTIYYKDKVHTWIKEGETITLYTTENPYGEWNKQSLSLSFTPNWQSLQAADEELYVLSSTGELFSSTNGVDWTTTDRTFYSLQGVWESQLLGVVKENGAYKHDYYPRPEGYTPIPVADDFPIAGSSPMVVFDSKWGSPQSIMVGGRTQHNVLTGATWGYDGDNWAQLDGSIQPCEGVALFPYSSFETNEYWETTEYKTWFAIGGRGEQGVTRAMYMTINNGNTWTEAPVSLSIPSYIKPRAYASAIVVESDYVAQPTGWKMMPATPWMRTITRAEDYKIPHIYLFGGEDNSGRVYNEIWRGVIGRLSYPPIP